MPKQQTLGPFQQQKEKEIIDQQTSLHGQTSAKTKHAMLQETIKRQHNTHYLCAVAAPSGPASSGPGLTMPS